MLTITALTARGTSSKSGADIIAYLKATEYMRDKDGHTVAASSWWGRGADALGLSGQPVDESAMDALAQGFAPDGTTKLCRNAGEKPKWVEYKDDNGNPLLDAKGKVRGEWQGGHRVGFELTFSSEKTLSIVFAAALPEERDRLRDAHDRAVDEALSYLQDKVETRRGKAGKDVIGVRGLVVSKHLHASAREHADTKTDGREWDPQLHTHALCFGIAQGDDGKWGTYDAVELYRNKMAAGALYRAALAHNLQNLGYGIEKKVDLDAEGMENGKVYLRVVGISEETRDAFSKRRADILAYQKEHGGTAQQACLATRKSKDEPTYDELTAMWTATLDRMRQEDPTMFRTTEELKGRESILGERVSDAKILEALHEKESIFTKEALIERLALEHIGRMSPKEILREADAFVKRAGIEAVAPEPIHIDDRGRTLARRHTADRYASKDVIALEQTVVDRAKARQHDTGVRVDKKLVDAEVKKYEQEHGFTLTTEQRRLVDWVTIETGGLAAVQGRAGTGKTATSGAWVSVFKAEGRGIIGAAVGWDAAKKLEAESGIKSYSTKSLIGQLDRGKLKLNPKSVVVLDEAGMAGLQTVARLQEHVDRSGAKLIIQGDLRQLQPVSNGSPFRLAIDAVGERSLTDIRRQRSQADRDTAAAFYADGGNGLRSRAENKRLGDGVLARLKKQNQIEAYGSQKEAMDGLVADYVADATPAREKLIIAGKRADVRALNVAVRTELKKAGRLGREEHKLDVLDRGEAGSLAVAVGDRVRFGKKDLRLGVVNGNGGVVEAFGRDDEGRLTLTVRLESDVKADENRRVRVVPAEYKNLQHAYASTVHKAQGQGKERVFHLADTGMTDRQLSLVAFTRTKGSYKLYGADADLDPGFLAERMGTDRMKANALEARTPVAPNPAPRDPSFRERMAQAWKQMAAGARRSKREQVRSMKKRIGVGL
jgi:conjugative relaxase-like TrwC/TraI family protein